MAQATNSATDPKDNRQQADDLLRRARQAMAEDDLEAAESLISAAESLDVRYGILHIGDTPKKARSDLQRMLAAAQKASGHSNGLFPPFSLEKDPPADPFTQRSGDSSTTELALGGSQLTELPKPETPKPEVLAGPDVTVQQPSIGAGLFDRPDMVPLPQSWAADPALPMMSSGRSALQSPIGAAADTILPPTEPSRLSSVLARAGGIDSTDGEAADRSKDLLHQARRALASGEVVRATELVNQARLRPASHAPLDDNPDDVEAAIRQYLEVAAQSGSTEGNRRGKVRMLMGQAEALLHYGDYDWAEQLANQAAREELTYDPFEARPQDLLDRIAVARQTAGRSAAASSPGTGVAEATDLPGLSPAERNSAIELSQTARAALDTGEPHQAEPLSHRSEQLQVPDSAYAPRQDYPELALLDNRRPSFGNQPRPGRATVESVSPAIGTSPVDGMASRALYEPLNDPTQNVRAAYEPAQGVPTRAPLPALSAAEPIAPPVDTTGLGGPELFALGEAALRAHDTQAASDYFRQAAAHYDELDPITRQRLQELLQLLSVPSTGADRGGPSASIVDQTATRQEALARQVAADIAYQASQARALLQSDPEGALAMMAEARQAVEVAALEPAAREQLFRLVDHHLADMRQFIDRNRGLIELENRNEQVREAIERDQRLKLEIQEKLALLVDDYRQKMNERRFAEAEVLAKRAAEIAPNEEVVLMMVQESKTIGRYFSNLALQAASEEGFWNATNSVAESGVPFNDNNPFVMPDAETWQELSPRRIERYLREQGRPRTGTELELERKLKTPVSLSFEETPLSTVLDHLAKLAQVNLFLDPQGLAQEGVTSSQPVTIDLSQDIMLESALNLILEPLHLSFVIKDEVLKITSEQLRDGEVYTVTYNVADLVIPIPNFEPGHTGLGAAYRRALAETGYVSAHYGMGAPPMTVLASRDGTQGSAELNPALLAQVSAVPGQLGSGGGTVPLSFGTGGMGGSSGADFGSLTELIVTTIEPLSWEDQGGVGSIAPFETNLSLVISNTQDVHEQIVDLLEQLRRMQDLQVTIEVRFITLNDNFFERLGVDFDFDINDDIDQPFQVWGRPDMSGSTAYVTDFTANTGLARDVMDRDGARSVTVGMSLPDIFSADLDIPFRQGSFQMAVPQFGGFVADAGAQIGFAILSDIEAFFFINAAQGDRRSNVLQAPKVTLFNGQQAMVTDQSESPFVSSVVPVVSDFAAAQQPVIVVLSEGTSMTVQAVVSNDRRFVRLTVVPLFSKIGDVNTFTFTGSQTTTTSTSAEGIQDEPNDNTSNSEASTITTQGTTVQLPTLSTVNVTTTVSVPDGGTVLLGGVKRLSEGRNEFGVPILAKLPYINRLFKNVAVGRETQSLMMMVTPRIIIAEEEEQAQTGFTATR